MEEIVDYIENTYEFEIVPCSIPSSEFQYIKINFYIWIMNNVSKKLFYFLRDKVSTIKYLSKRKDGSIWLWKRMSDGKLCEIEVNIEVNTIYLFDYNGNEVERISLICLGVEKLDTLLIDKHLCQIPELKEFNRNKKLEKLLL